MPLANVRGAKINYEVLGTRGEWIALTPGGRLGLEHVRSIARLLADAGYRVLIHDRRNCGASDVVLEGNEPEHELWADDLYELLSQLNALPAYIGGRSSGCRLSLIFALRHPGTARALLLWRITGGPYAAERLAHKYYGEYIAAARQGGMAAVCATEHFMERIKDRPANRDRLMQADPARFIAAMSHWSSYFSDDANKPVIGASEAELRSINIPACIVPGNDRIHSRRVGENLSRLMPDSELHVLMPEEHDVDMSPNEDWVAKQDELAALFADFLRRVQSRASIRTSQRTP
jgi:pimeloyl-ACP methyl ester carboxylesterase